MKTYPDFKKKAQSQNREVSIVTGIFSVDECINQVWVFKCDALLLKCTPSLMIIFMVQIQTFNNDTDTKVAQVTLINHLSIPV